jgi:hypothetical protein
MNILNFILGVIVNNHLSTLTTYYSPVPIIVYQLEKNSRHLDLDYYYLLVSFDYNDH